MYSEVTPYTKTNSKIQNPRQSPKFKNSRQIQKSKSKTNSKNQKSKINPRQIPKSKIQNKNLRQIPRQIQDKFQKSQSKTNVRQIPKIKIQDKVQKSSHLQGGPDLPVHPYKANPRSRTQKLHLATRV